MKNSTRLERIRTQAKQEIQSLSLSERTSNSEYYDGLIAGINACIAELKRLEK